MNSSINKPVLPQNPTLKDINKYKRQLNWGELPAFYHLVASSVSELESIQTMGFDNALNRICKKSNWNLDLLEGYIDKNNVIHVDKKPRLALYQIFNVRGFEIHCFPLAKDKEVNQYIKGHRLIEFVEWDPASMSVLFRINQINKFIDFYFQRGDPADKALVIYAIKCVEKLIDYLSEYVEIIKIEGESLKDYFEEKEKKLDDAEIESLILGELKGNDFSK